ncbi:MAG: NAD+ synthase [Phycisphaerae bacterium]|nr:NAD+ synthase [Phycisphaerae bacterium]
MQIAVPRFDPTIGDLAGNARLILEAAESAVAAGAHVVLLPELALCGYPPRDLLLRKGFVDACEQELDRLAAMLPPDVLVLVGTPVHGPRPTVRNALVALRDGTRVVAAAKRLMPDYDVFDEDRWFTAGHEATVIEHRGLRLGLLVCEDLWQGGDAQVEVFWPCDPVADLVAVGVDAILAASASPWVAGKGQRQTDRVSQVAKQSGVDVVAVNQAGANDDLVFGGEVIHADSAGTIQAGRYPFCQRDHELVVHLGGPVRPHTENDSDRWSDTLIRALALREAIHGYVTKTRSNGVLIGLSGGIDSALTATLAVAALGPSRVQGVAMPSRYSADESLRGAAALCESLGMKAPLVLPIEDAHRAVWSIMEAGGTTLKDGELPDQNVQARIRGQLLMAHSNLSGQLVLATGNKSELAVGYSTLYGDMCGAVAVLGDVLKTQVYAMSKAINADPAAIGLDRSPIPQETIDRPPTAELAPNQCDQDSLPPYEVLDAIIRCVVDEDESAERTAESAGLDLELVRHWMQVIDRNEFKRWQAAIIPKVSRRAFGRGRRWPLVAKT